MMGSGSLSLAATIRSWRRNPNETDFQSIDCRTQFRMVCFIRSLGHESMLLPYFRRYNMVPGTIPVLSKSIRPVGITTDSNLWWDNFRRHGLRLGMVLSSDT